MAERRSFRDIISNIRYTDNRTSYKRSTGYDFLRDDPNDSAYGSNLSFIQGYNTRAGDWNVEGLGNGQSNSAVVACLQVLGTSFSEAELKVYFENEVGELEVFPKHPLSNLFKRPNPFMSGDVVQNYLITAMHISGDAYLLKQKNDAGEVVALYPLMPENVTPKGSEETLIEYYSYETNNKTVALERDMIVHFRLGLDPSNHRKGFSPLKTILREIYGDESAGQLATALLANMGVPSFLVTPKDEYGFSEEEGEAISKTFQRKVAGKNRGKPLVLSGGVNVEKLAFSPKDLEIGALREEFESRASAVLGVPAILAGLQVGLKNATYANAKTLREFFTEQKLIPLWNLVAGEISAQLLPDYTEADKLVTKYDLTDVRALQTDTNEIYERMNVAVQGGWATVAEARQAVGLPIDTNQDVYLLGTEKVIVPADMLKEQELQVETPQEQPVQNPLASQEEPETSSQENAEYKVIKEIDGEYCVISERTGRNMGCYPTRKLAQTRLDQIHRYSNDKVELEKDIFTTQEEAENRAKELGCSGFHTMEQDVTTYYMPCSSHDKYEELVEDNDSGEY